MIGAYDVRFPNNRSKILKQNKTLCIGKEHGVLWAGFSNKLVQCLRPLSPHISSIFLLHFIVVTRAINILTRFINNSLLLCGGMTSFASYVCIYTYIYKTSSTQVFIMLKGFVLVLYLFFFLLS